MYQKRFHEERIPALGFGALRFPAVKGDPDRIDRAAAQKIVDAAMACGINYFDTSHTYQQGGSERFLGEALAPYPRGSYFLATKFYVTYRADLERLFFEQLARCRTDYFDFYLFHCLDAGTIDLYMDPRRRYLDFLLQQKAAGRIRYLGFSSHAAPEVLERFLNWYDGFDMAMIQLNYLDWTLLDAKRQYEILTRHGVPVWVMEPMKGGRLSVLSEEAAAVLRSAAPDRSLSSWGFRFLQGLDNVQCVLSGMSAVEQVWENAVTFAHPHPLSGAEQETLDRAGRAFVRAMGAPCSACRYCCASCPAGLDIPLLIRAYNERRISGKSWRVKIPAGMKDAAACIQCGTCRERCPQKIDIPAIMREMAAQ